MKTTKRVYKASAKKANSAINASTRRNRVVADEEIGVVDVAPEASDLLFEAEDVAELVAEVTGQDVEVAVDEDAVSVAAQHQ